MAIKHIFVNGFGMVWNLTTDFHSASGGRLALFISVTVGLLLGGGSAHAQTASALVLEKSGSSAPEVQPYTEISVGTTISLSSETRLVFQHYQTCRMVTVVGGKVRFGAEMYTITGGSKEKETKTPCPRIVTLKGGGESGGVLMRGSNLVTLPRQPVFVLVGRRAGDFSIIRVSKGGKVLLKTSLIRRLFKWPTDVLPLAAGTRYELVLISENGSGKPIAIKFKVAAQELGNERLLLIRSE